MSAARVYLSHAVVYNIIISFATLQKRTPCSRHTDRHHTSGHQFEITNVVLISACSCQTLSAITANPNADRFVRDIVSTNAIFDACVCHSTQHKRHCFIGHERKMLPVDVILRRDWPKGSFKRSLIVFIRDCGLIRSLQHCNKSRELHMLMTNPRSSPHLHQAIITSCCSCTCQPLFLFSRLHSAPIPTIIQKYNPLQDT